MRRLLPLIQNALAGAVALTRGHCINDGLVFQADWKMGLIPIGALARDQYEQNELQLLKRILRPEDRVLEIGAGIGFLALHSARLIGEEQVTAIEANPEIFKLAVTNAKNNALQVKFLNGVISAQSGHASFNICPQFWKSTTKEGMRAARTVTVPALAWSDIFLRSSPSVLVVDIEGGEEDLIGFWGLDGVRSIIIEIHPWIIGESMAMKVSASLNEAGFREVERSGNVHLFERIQ